jgi:hypothetical protein
MSYISKLLRVGFTNIVGYLNVNLNIDDYKKSYKNHFDDDHSKKRNKNGLDQRSFNKINISL